MKRVLIGHRGVGKTSLLQRHQSYFPEVDHFDLDQVIERQAGRSIGDIFNTDGEQKFRQLELQTYQRLLKENNQYVIAVGAGFNPAYLTSDEEVIFVSRTTDADGRIFLNRPRLNPETSALGESRKRYIERQSAFLKRADQIYHMPEGIDSENNIERQLLTGEFKITSSVYTLSAHEVSRVSQLKKNYSQIELRTDLIDVGTIENLVGADSNFNWLVSIREEVTPSLPATTQIDCDVNLAIISQVPVAIYSSHDEKIQIGIDKLNRTTKPNTHLKLCPIVKTFTELRTGYDWQQQDPANRSFLPRSEDGRWVWYRQLSRYLQKLNFIRNFSCIADQPSAYENLVLPIEKPTSWAAVLGKPVYFSRTPLVHEKFFTPRKTFVTKIEITTEELSTNLDWLIQLGLTYAAVTSPLKETAYQLSEDLSPEAKSLKSVNTLYIDQKKVCGHNTDLAGFRFLIEDFISVAPEKIAIWGGGGTLQMIKEVLPQAKYFSSQTGELRDAALTAYLLPEIEILIWAAPRTARTLFPSKDLKITRVIDLNYTENSMGLEFAAERILKYKSGLEMFKQQALKQQEYWSAK